MRFDDPLLTRKVIREERLSVAVVRGHPVHVAGKPLHLRHIVGEPLIVYPRSPRPSYADQVLSFYRDQGLEPKVAFEVRELQTALGLVASGAGICLVPTSVRRLGRDDVAYLDLDEPKVVTPIVMSYRANDKSPLLAQLRKLIREFDQWTPPEPAGGED